jgi:hypothetical protein
MSFLINSFLFATAACTSGVNTSGLTGYWRFDGDSSDVQGSFPGTDTNCAYVTGYLSQALSVSGSNQYTQMGNSSSLQATTFTVCAWVYVKTINSYQSIIDNLGYDDLGPYRVMVSNSDRQFLFTIGANNVWSSTNSVTANTWHHIALTKTNTSTAKFYINGVETDFGTNTTRNVTTTKFVVGGRWRNSTSTYPDSYFNGLVDDCAYFNRTLTANEIKTIYTAATVNGCRLA